MPIQFIDGKCHIKQLKAGKRYKTCLTNYIRTAYITPYHATGYYALGGGHTDRHTNIPMCEQKQYQETKNIFKPGAWPKAACTWFKNILFLLKHPQNIKVDFIINV